ncbi:bacteriohemerythrin [Caenispirillum salinarum]|uniref:bacteriohemerythrin n=1 Tax=Caenispirillum salinarum TaxID=859058 RepID=UPI00384C8D88
MALITWQDSYSVGVDMIDADHQLLVSLINQLDDAMTSGAGADTVGSVLNVLIEYTETHFGREELLMEKGGYPELEPHKKEHAKLTGQVRAIVDRYNAGDIGSVDAEVMEFLKNWLTGHILGVDRKYTPYVEGLTLTPEELMASMNFGLEDASTDEEDGWEKALASSGSGRG